MKSRPVHSVMLSSHLFLRPPCLLLPFTVLCKIILVKLVEWETCPYHRNLHLYMMVRRSSCDPLACWILARTSSLVTCLLYEMHNILQYYPISIACILFCSCAVRVHLSVCYPTYHHKYVFPQNQSKTTTAKQRQLKQRYTKQEESSDRDRVAMGISE